MRVESLDLRLRARAPLEAADLGSRLCQHAAIDIYRSFAIAYAIVIVLALPAFLFSPWGPILVIFLAKPWLDRSILFVLARRAFGQRTSMRDLWQNRRSVWFSQWLRTLVLQRLTIQRSFIQPAIQLEGLRGRELRDRVKLLQTGHRGAKYALLTACSFAETALSVAALSLLMWFMPTHWDVSMAGAFLVSPNAVAQAIGFAAYAGAVFIVEPHFVAGGFGMYLNRRVELEAWDIEQDLRRAFQN